MATKHVLFWVASLAAGGTAAIPLPPLITDSPILQGPAWEGVVNLSFPGIQADMIEALLPVAIVCAVSLLCTAMWLSATGAHLRSRDSRTA
jgi:hypothetical protein